MIRPPQSPNWSSGFVGSNSDWRFPLARRLAPRPSSSILISHAALPLTGSLGMADRRPAVVRQKLKTEDPISMPVWTLARSMAVCVPEVPVPPPQVAITAVAATTPTAQAPILMIGFIIVPFLFSLNASPEVFF